MNIFQFSIFALFLILSYSVNADDDTTKQSQWGEASGQLRFYYIFDPSYVKSGRTNDYKVDGSALGGHIRYTSPTFSNFGASTALYYAQNSGLNDTQDPDTMVAAGRFFTKDYSAKAVIGELNLFYKDEYQHAVVGRQKIDSPLTNSISTYMPNMFEALYYSNSGLDGYKFTFLQIDTMAYGTRAPVEFGIIGEATRTAGTSQSAVNIRGKFLPIEQQILADTSSRTNGITGLAITNTSLKNTTFRAWDFYAYDIINMLYFDADYKNSYNDLPYSLSAQYLNVHSVGRNLASAWLDAESATLSGLKVGFDYKNISTYLAYNHSGDAKLLNPFGGDPAYTSSYFSRSAYRANVDAYKAGVNIALAKNFKIIMSHADYGQSTTMGTFVAAQPVEAPAKPKTDAKESALLFSYNPIESLNILTGAIYKTSEYYYASKEVNFLDFDLLVTYRF
ncbi:MAG: hypothetical protein WC667_12730 [Sulfurimonas sp.]|jgi:hypothetical protein